MPHCSASDLEQTLATERLVLEPILPSHARLLYKPVQDERMWRFIPFRLRPASVEALELRFARYASRASADGLETWLNYAMRKRHGPYVGWVQATIAGHAATIGYSVFADHWRQGYGKEACAELLRFMRQRFGITSVAAIVDTENAASIALLEALNFTRVWTGPSDDMPGRTDHRYEFYPPKVPGATSAL